jgi:malonyl-CoA O-methyltransferase
MDVHASDPDSGHIHNRPPTHDPAACWRWWRGVPGVTAPAWLHEEVARRMQDRLQWIKLQPRDWINVNPSIGGFEAHTLITRRYPQATCQVQEPSERRLLQSKQALGASRLRRWLTLGRGEPSWLVPGADPEPADMMWANMQLHLHPDPQALLSQWHRALRVDGFLMFSCLGPDALQELRHVYQVMGWPPSGPTWTDMHDWGDMLVQGGFAEPVMDMERITLSYARAPDLINELRTLGRNLHPQRFAGLLGKGWRGQLSDAIEKHWPRRNEQGQLLLTFEIVYGHALRAPVRHMVEASTRISLGEMKKMLKPGQK